MNRWVRGGIGAVVVLGAAVGAVWILGARLPVDHVATVGAHIEAPPQDVWRAITDLERLPEWRSGVVSVEMGHTPDGRPTWTETDGTGETVAYEVVSLRFPDHAKVRMGDDTAPFGGTWTWALSSEGAGCFVTITEEGYVRPAPLRAIAKYAIGHDATMRVALIDLGRRFGQDVVVTP